jgi:hypothetical protein
MATDSGSRRRRSSPWSCGATRPSITRSPCRRAAGSWSWAGSGSGPGRLRMAAPGRWSRSWQRSWGRVCVGRRRPRPGRRGTRTGSQLDRRCDGAGCGRSMPSVPLRCVRAVEGAGRLFSTPSRSPSNPSRPHDKTTRGGACPQTFSTQDEVPGASPGRPTTPGLSCRKLVRCLVRLRAALVRRLGTAVSERIPSRLS